MTLFFSTLDRCLLLAIQLLAGRSATERLVTVANWHYPLVDSQAPRIRRSRLYFRSLIFLSSTRRWLTFIFDNPAMTQAAVRNQDLIEKIHRPYLSKQLSCQEREALLQSHYTFCESHPHGPVLLAASLANIELAEVIGKSGAKFKLALMPSGALQKEGELTVQCAADGLALFQLAFSVGRSDAARCLFIGCLQSSPDERAKEKIREATKEMHGLRARNLALIAIQAIAGAYGIQRIFAVSDKQHIYRHWRKRRQIMQNYDDMWLDLGGAAASNGMFELPLQHVQRALSEYPSNKRSGISKRHALELHITQAIAAAIQQAGAAAAGNADMLAPREVSPAAGTAQ